MPNPPHVQISTPRSPAASQEPAFKRDPSLDAAVLREADRLRKLTPEKFAAEAKRLDEKFGIEIDQGKPHLSRDLRIGRCAVQYVLKEDIQQGKLEKCKEVLKNPMAHYSSLTALCSLELSSNAKNPEVRALLISIARQSFDYTPTSLLLAGAVPPKPSLPQESDRRAFLLTRDAIIGLSKAYPHDPEVTDLVCKIARGTYKSSRSSLHSLHIAALYCLERLKTPESFNLLKELVQNGSSAAFGKYLNRCGSSHLLVDEAIKNAPVKVLRDAIFKNHSR